MNTNKSIGKQRKRNMAISQKKIIKMEIHESNKYGKNCLLGIKEIY